MPYSRPASTPASFSSTLLQLPLLALLAVASPGSADVPDRLHLQARLSEASGLPLDDPSLPMTFRIFAEAELGEPLWEESLLVDVREGILSVQLGAGVANPAYGSLDASLRGAGDRWLELQVAGETLAPRFALDSAPYAREAAHATTATAVVEGGIDATMLQAESVGAEALEDGGVIRAKLAASAVGTAEIEDGGVLAQDVAFAWAGSTSPGGPALDLQCSACVSASELDASVADGHSLDASGGSAEDVVFVDAQGRVGLRTSEPTAELDLRGPLVLIPGRFFYQRSGQQDGHFGNRCACDQSTVITSCGPSFYSDEGTLDVCYDHGVDAFPNPRPISVVYTRQAAAPPALEMSADGQIGVGGAPSAGTARLQVFGEGELIEATSDAGTAVAARNVASESEGSLAAGAYGVLGGSPDGHAVRGVSANGVGVSGSSSTGTGAEASSGTGTGLLAESFDGTGLIARSTNGLAGDFEGAARIQGDLELQGHLDVEGDLDVGDVLASGLRLVPGLQRYLHVPGNSFVPEIGQGNDTWALDPDGFGFIGTGTGSVGVELYAPVQIPTGAASLNELRCYRYDNNVGADLTDTATLFRRTLGSIAAVPLGSASATSTSTANFIISDGFGSFASPSVDNRSFVYYLRVDWSQDSASSSLRFYGCRIAYLQFEP